MKLRQLEVFYAVYLRGTVSSAARSLGVSQPTISKTLARLEDRVGFALFERTGGRLHPTPRSERLFVAVEPIFEQVSELQTLLATLSNEHAGHLRFSMTPAFSLEVGPNAISQFSKHHPDVVLEAETLHADELSRKLSQNQIDAGLVFDAPKLSGVQSTRVGRTGFLCLSPSETDYLRDGPVRLADLAHIPLIELNTKSVLGRRLRQDLTSNLVVGRQSRLIVETYHLAKRLVRKGAGVAIVDAVTALSGDRTGLRFHAIPELETIDIDFLTPLSGRSSAMTENLKSYLGEELRRLTDTELYRTLVR